LTPNAHLIPLLQNRAPAHARQATRPSSHGCNLQSKYPKASRNTQVIVKNLEKFGIDALTPNLDQGFMWYFIGI
jgi:hypothetical protein